MNATYFLGIDGGATKSRARLTDSQGVILAEVEDGPAALNVGDGSVAHRSVVSGARAAFARAGLPEAAMADCVLCAGLSGQWVPDAEIRLHGDGLPFRQTILIHDVHAACLGAHRGRDGGVVVMGTGSIACAVVGGVKREVGGWGFVADDHGSGADIGRRATHLTLRSCDGDVEGGRLGTAVLERFGNDPYRLGAWAARATPGQFGELTPTVFALSEEGDPAAVEIINFALNELRRLVTLTEKIGAPRIALYGSVARRLSERLPEIDRDKIVEPEADAMDGALMMARGLV